MILSELWYCLKYEMCLTAMDFFERRTGRLFFEVPETEPLVEKVIKEMAKQLKWSRSQKKEELNAVLKAIEKNKNLDLIA